MKTLKDVLHNTGLSYSTLVKYTGLGLVPKPQRVWRGRKGSESWYPNDVIDTIKHIKEEQSSGLTLRQIAENRKVERATDVFADIMVNYPDYHFISGEIIKSDENPDGSIVVEVKMVGVKRSIYERNK